MAKVEDQINLFAKLGVDPRSEEAILAERAAEGQQAILASAKGVDNRPGMQDVRSAGAGIAAAIANKFGKPKLTAEQQIHADAAKQARAIVQQQIDDGLYRDPETGQVDQVARAHALEKQMGRALVDAGDQRGIPLLIAAGKRESSQEKDALERQKAGLDILNSREILNQREYERSRRIVSAMATVWPNDSMDENDRQELYIDGQGNARNPSSMDIVFPAGQWSKHAPVTPEALKGILTGELTPLQQAVFPSKKNLSEYQQRERALMEFMESQIKMFDAIESAVGPDGQLNVMSTGGDITSGIVKFVDNTRAAIKGTIGSFTIVGSDGTEKKISGTIAEADKFARENEELFAGIDYSGWGIDRTDSIARTKMNSLFSLMAFQQANLNEQGGRFSDRDIAEAAVQLATNSTSPEALRQTLRNNTDTREKSLQLWQNQYHPSVRDIVITQDAQDMMNDTRQRWEARTNFSFGTPTNATLTPPSTSEPEVVDFGSFMGGDEDFEGEDALEFYNSFLEDETEDE